MGHGAPHGRVARRYRCLMSQQRSVMRRIVARPSSPTRADRRALRRHVHFGCGCRRRKRGFRAAVARVPGAVFEATHLPPLLVLPGEPVAAHVRRALRSRRAWTTRRRAATSPGRCSCASTAAATSRRSRCAEPTPRGIRQLTASVPDSFAAAPSGFEYYAELERVGTGDRLLVPPGGAAAPYRSHVAEQRDRCRPRRRTTSARIAAEPESRQRAGVTARLRRARAGKEPRSDRGSAFDVDAGGTVFLLDEAHRRVLRWARGAQQPARVPVSVDGTARRPGGRRRRLALRPRVGRATRARRPARSPLRRDGTRARRRRDGRAVAVTDPHGAGWAGRPGAALAPVDARRARRHAARRRSEQRAPSERPDVRCDRVARSSSFARGNEIRSPSRLTTGVERSWRLTSETPLGEVQLAEPIGRASRPRRPACTGRADEFVVARSRSAAASRQQFALDVGGLGRDGAARAASGSSADPSTSSARTRPELFVDRYDLEVR